MVSKVLEKMILYFNGDIKRINHALKVYGYSKIIAGNEALSDKLNTIVELAAILHDIGIKEAERKYRSSSGKYQEMEGPPIAEQMLSGLSINKCVIDRVSYIIGNHHSYGKIDGPDFQILVEADLIVNIEEEGLDFEAAKRIKKKYFMTDSGKKLLEAVFNTEICN